MGPGSEGSYESRQPRVEGAGIEEFDYRRVAKIGAGQRNAHRLGPDKTNDKVLTQQIRQMNVSHRRSGGL